MFFLGSTFCGGTYTADSPPVNNDDVTNITIKNFVCDTLYGDNTYIAEWDENIMPDWDFSTAFRAHYFDNLLAGNISFSINTIDKLLIKRREKGALTFSTIYTAPISSIDDLTFEFIDYTIPAGTWEYAFVPALGDSEGNMQISTITTSYNGAFLIGQNSEVYQLIMNLQVSHHRVRGGSSVTTLGSWHPFYVSNGNTEYEAGSVSVTLIPYSCTTKTFDMDNAWIYREQFEDFLTNGRPKLLKMDTGQMWLVSICTDTISTDESSYLTPIISFDWQQCGNELDENDLYAAGFTTVLTF